MDFPEKAIVGILGDLTAIKADVQHVDHLDRIAKQRAMVELMHKRQGGQTVLIASHDEELLEQLCDEIWWAVDGHITHRGAPAGVLQAYRKHAAQVIRHSGDGHSVEVAPAMRRGDGRARITGIELLGESGQPTMVWSSGENVRVRVSLHFERAVDDPVVGMLIRTRIGLNVYGTNTELEMLKFGPCAAGETVEVVFSFSCELCPGEYTLTIASHDPDGVWHDWLEDAVAFSVTDTRYTAGVANLRAKVEVIRK
jgi:hypothetical protein